MRIKILREGDKVISVTSDFVAVERISGEVDIVPINRDKSGIWVNTEHITTIGYGDNIVELETNNGVKITSF